MLASWIALLMIIGPSILGIIVAIILGWLLLVLLSSIGGSQ